MENRLRNIIYLLTSGKTPLTSDEISKRLDVSSRTIKTDMENVRSELEKVGASLTARRNQGYSIKINDSQLFSRFLEQMSLKAGRVDNFVLDDMSKFLYVTRKLVSFTGYVKIDDIADEMYTSRSTLRNSIKEAQKFLSSFHLVTEKKSGLGMRVFGMEHHVRVAMMELFANHFHKSPLDYSDMGYATWLNCEDKERQDIRHIFLRTLVPSGLSIIDLYTQRLANYLIISRNRYQAGYDLALPEKSVEEIKQYQEYRIATTIFSKLAKEIPGYDMPEQEISFFSILLLCNRDMGHIKADRKSFPTLYDEAQRYAGELLEYVRDEYNIDLNIFDWVFEELKSILIPLMAKEHFSLSGMEVIDSPTKSEVSSSPLALEIARAMLSHLQNIFGNQIVDYNNIQKLVCLVYKVLFFVSFDIKKLNLLIVNMDGINLGDLTKKQLMTFFPGLIESCTNVELYEIRNMDQSKYDGVLMNYAEYSYNYDLPFASLHTITHNGELKGVFNTILIHAYQTQHLLPDESLIHVYQDFDYISEEQLFQLLSVKHCPDNEKQKNLQQLFINNELKSSYRTNNQTVTLFGKIEWTEQESIDIYFLKNPGEWSGGEIKYILYVCLDWENNIQKLKAVENCLCQLTLSPELFQLFLDDKKTALEEIMKKALKEQNY